MKFIYGKNDLKTMARAEENCYLLTNGLGGYSSLTMAGSSTRADHVLFMTADEAPAKKRVVVVNTVERLVIGDREYNLFSQSFADNRESFGYAYLDGFSFEYLPQYRYKVSDVEVIKTISMKYEENILAVQYNIINHGKEKVKLKVIPLLPLPEMSLNYHADGAVRYFEQRPINGLYYEYDNRDGRKSEGTVYVNHELIFNGHGKHYIVYGGKSSDNLDVDVDEIIEAEIARQKKLVKLAGLNNPVAGTLVRASDNYIVRRDSTGGKTIIAGYPFFGDWGRDTMIAMVGCAIVTKRYDDARSILSTFIKHCRQGLMPNLFPEGEDEPAYNTVDASLLFINALYEYYQATGDKEFVSSAYDTVEDIISWYIKGTDFGIKMDEDGLIKAGNGLWQLTWMDVRVGDILPTPRHGKPVEVNAYWYNALMIADYLKDIKGESAMDYLELAGKVKVNFMEKFWNYDDDCLKDVISGTEEECQIRCNQIWAVSLPFSMLDKEYALAVLRVVYRELYTPLGLRTLSPKDKKFKGFYGGSMEKRDLAYHQGTVWAYPLGAYYLARLRWAEDKTWEKKHIIGQLEAMEATLREGCIGQIAEVFDGINPTESKGCFAQAWSVGEILRVYGECEKY